MSQHQEDRLVRRLFPKGYKGTAVEVGAGDGVLLSNTLWMEKKGWRVVCIEPHPDLFSSLSRNRKCAVHAACWDSAGERPLLVYPSQGSAHHDMVSVVTPLTERFGRTYLKGDGSYSELSAVRTATLDSILEDEGIAGIDFVSIDVDGSEMVVLNGFDIRKWSPKVVLIENPFEDDTLVEWFYDHGYYRERAAIGGFNDIYVAEAR